jgi:hypothetical protein
VRQELGKYLDKQTGTGMPNLDKIDEQMARLDHDYWEQTDEDFVGYNDIGPMPCGECGECTDCLANIYQRDMPI